MVTYEDLERVNKTIKTTDIKGKDYAEVNQRIKAFRMLYPDGTITTNMLSNDNGICVFKASVIDNSGHILATGTAYEKENSTFINKTSYIENCETSAIGRALGIAGFGIDTSIASAEEVTNAINNQVVELTEEEAKKITIDFGKHNGKTLTQIIGEDKGYLNYLFQHGTSEIKSAITLLTGMKDLPLEESKQEINNMPITEAQKQQIKDLYTPEEIKDLLKQNKRSKLSDLTFEEARKMIGE